MKLYYPITVDLYNPHPLPRMNAQQHNVGRGALVTLTANGQVMIPSEETVRIFARRPDGNVSYLDCTITGDEKVQADFTDQMLAAEGSVQVELELATKETNITTPIFIVEVGKSNVKEGVQSSNEYKALEKYTESSLQAAEEAKEASGTAQRVLESIPEDYQTAVEFVKATAITSSASGQTFHETDCAAVPPVNIELFGKGTQKTYEGRNMFNISNCYISNASSQITERLENGLIAQGAVSETKPGQNVASSGQILFKSDGVGVYIEAGTTITLSFDYTVLENQLGTEYDISYSMYRHVDGGSIMITPSAIPKVGVKTRFSVWRTVSTSSYYSPVISLNSCLVKIENIQIEIGDTATEYEPYVGCKQSPSVDYPQEVTHLGESGSIIGTIEENGLTFTALTPNGLGGIPLGQTIPDVIKNSPIHLAGVYWDEVEQQYYIGDTKNENGKDVQRIGIIDSYSGEEIAITPYMSTTGELSEGATVHYILPEPIVTDLTAEEIAQYNALRMNYPNTTIVNDAGAYMEVEYVADTRKHIEKNYVAKSELEDIKTQLSEVRQVIANL